MDRTNSNGSSKNSSILSASWNVVDSQDLNHSSEGSDAESIEVIDEDTHNAKFGINEGKSPHKLISLTFFLSYFVKKGI